MTRTRKMDEEKEAEYLDENSPDNIEACVYDINDDKNEKYDEEKDAECLDYTSLDYTEEGVNDRNNDNNEQN